MIDGDGAPVAVRDHHSRRTGVRGVRSVRDEDTSRREVPVDVRGAGRSGTVGSTMVATAGDDDVRQLPHEARCPRTVRATDA